MRHIKVTVFFVALQPRGTTFHKSTLTLIPGCGPEVKISRLTMRTLQIGSENVGKETPGETKAPTAAAEVTLNKTLREEKSEAGQVEQSQFKTSMCLAFLLYIQTNIKCYMLIIS